MGPRLMSRGKVPLMFPAAGTSIASMGPRLMSRGKYFAGYGFVTTLSASMGPRLMSRGKPAPRKWLFYTALRRALRVRVDRALA